MKDCCSSNDVQAIKPSSNFSVALVGNPNCGKTTLFNALTGARQHVGNWPGVTVERKSGFFTEKATTVEVIDLPGVYSLTLASETSAIDEHIANEFILQNKADVVINIVDASNLDRHLYLTLQLLEMDVPVILALNMMDVARSRDIEINMAALAKILNCPVIALAANKNQGVHELKNTILSYDILRRNLTQNNLTQKTAHPILTYPPIIQESIAKISSLLQGPAIKNNGMAMRLLEDDYYARSKVSAEVLENVTNQQQLIRQELNEDPDILLAETRYQFIQQSVQQCVKQSPARKKSWTNRIDHIVLNRVLGIPIFLSVMYFLFFFSINIGGAFQDFFDMGSQTIFVDGFAHLLTEWHAPTWLTALLANGIGKGINTTITFIPVIGALFLILALLEDSGYMARAAFVIDRFMRMLGLPGKAFVPMIVGFGCNVPAIMAARTLENKRDRILTIMMSPFMSCGARLAIYAVFTAAFFPHGGQNIVFALYLIGILMAIFTGFLLRKTVLQGDPAPLVMELPPYHVPRLRTLLLHAWQRLKGFVFRAGKLIVPICVLIGALNALNIDGTINAGDGDAHSLLSIIGRWVTPIFAPMGIHVDNWPATVGLVTGILAKEVVVGTLNTLYTQIGHFAVANNDFHFWANLHAALNSIPENFAQLRYALSNPVLAKAPISTVDQGVYGLMYQKFDGQIGAFAYLLFVLLYFPCVSTTAVMLRELHRAWSYFSIIWMTSVAYFVAVLFYQTATWMRHPLSSSIWIIAIFSVFFVIIMMVRWYTNENEKNKNNKVDKKNMDILAKGELT